MYSLLKLYGNFQKALDKILKCIYNNYMYIFKSDRGT